MPDFQKDKIHAIWDSDYTKCNVGSTAEQLSKRMTKHRDTYKHHLHNNGNFTIAFYLRKKICYRKLQD